MKAFRSQPLPSASQQPSSATSFWSAQQRENSNVKVWGRIQDTGANYVVEGYVEGGDLEWVRIPCKRLLDAQLYLETVMSKKDFEWMKALEDFMGE
jgi:hypothetical protein